MQRLEGILREAFPKGLRVRGDVSGKNLTTFALGGPVSVVAEPQGIDELIALLKFVQSGQLIWSVLGAGSNVLVPDAGVQRVVVRLGKEFSGYHVISAAGRTPVGQEVKELMPQQTVEPVKGTEGEEVRVVAFGAAPLMSLSRKLSAVGYSGLEFAAGIPGSLGGAVFMNAGAHGSQMSAIVRRVFVVDASGFHELHAAELKFSYRHSSLPKDSIVVGAELALVSRPVDEVTEKRNKSLDYRKRTQPLHLPSAGSVFRNPEPGSDGCQRAAAELIEAVGLKGYRIGGAAISEMHSNWIVNDRDNAIAADVVALVHLAQEKVKDRFGITLRQELVCW